MRKNINSRNSAEKFWKNLWPISVYLDLARKNIVDLYCKNAAEILNGNIWKI